MKTLTWILLVTWGLLSAGCGDDDDDDSGDGDADADADGDSDADADGDGDGDGDGDADGDADGDGDGDGDADADGELCNGQDDDGDGQIDEGNPESGFFCRTDNLGECSVGHTSCEDGAQQCVADVGPIEEACDNYGRDDDCNGQVDDIEGLDEACDTGLDGVCAAGTTMCDGADFVCSQDVLASPEGCDDGQDDDCNGIVDDGPAPVPESCVNRGRDDDCNGVIDDIIGEGDSCDTGLDGICAEGTRRCVGGELICDGDLNPRIEACPNGLDDDCDGVVDDGIIPVPETCANPGVDDDCNGVRDDVPEEDQPCDTGLPGICALGVTNCVAPNLVCVQTYDPGAEQCGNAIDDDCDGETDEAGCVDIPCSELARQLCEERGWVIVDEPQGGNIVCTIDGRGDGNNCDTCDTYNIYVWQDGSQERYCPDVYSTVAGEIYSAHTPCACGDNLDFCDTWNVTGCVPD